GRRTSIRLCLLADLLPFVPHSTSIRLCLSGCSPANSYLVSTSIRFCRLADLLPTRTSSARRSAGPRLPEAGVVPAEGDQLVVGALLDHGALRHHQDAVGDLRLREPVGDDDRGAAAGHLECGALEHAGTGGALVGRGLVEDQHGRVAQRDPGQGQLLGLLGGEALTLL